MDLGRLFKDSFNYLVSYPVFFVPAFVTALVVLVLGFMVTPFSLGVVYRAGSIKGAIVILILLVVLVKTFVQLFVSSILTHMAYRASEGSVPALEESFQTVRGKLRDVVVLALIVSVAVSIGFMMFIIPGLVVAFLTIFSLQEVVIGDKQPMEAVKGSYNLVKENFVDILVFFVIVIVLLAVVGGILGMMPLGRLLANFILTPFVSIIVTLCYLSLVSPTLHRTSAAGGSGS
jgi:uncharacterized membrane protein